MSDDVHTALGMTLGGGRFRLHRFIAQGGMGAVYEGTDAESPGTRVACKLLHSRFADDEELLARLKREARIAKDVVSPHVARVIQAGANRERRGWVVFEFLDGEGLDARLKREHRLPFADVAWIIEHALLGLDAAHRLRIVHRDVKPANLFLEREPVRLRVLDFGLAKRLRRDVLTAASALTQTSPLTQLGDVLGTPVYMSPEQLEDAQDIDVRTDIYSVGLVAYRILTGGLPFEHRELGAIFELKHVGAIASLAHATGLTWPEPLERWIRKATARHREERFDSAHDALTAWHGAVDAMKGFVQVEATASETGAANEADTDPAPPVPPRRSV